MSELIDPPLSIVAGTRVVDELLPWNQGRFVLWVADGVGQVERGGQGRMRLPIRDLVPLYGGYFTPEELRLKIPDQAPNVAQDIGREAGRAQGHAQLLVGLRDRVGAGDLQLWEEDRWRDLEEGADRQQGAAWMGSSLDALSAALQVHPESLRTYWKRIYRQLACSDRQRIRAWLEALLLQELGAPHVAERLAASPLWSSGAAAS